MVKYLYILILILAICSCNGTSKVTAEIDSSFSLLTESQRDSIIGARIDHQKDSIVKSYKSPDSPSTLISKGTTDTTLLQILKPETYRLPLGLRSNWPHAKWSYAKLFVYNLNGRKTPPPYKTLLADSAYHQVISLNQEQAETAIELKHRAGNVKPMTKCPIIVRHAVVYFNKQDEVVAGIGICFQCKEQLHSPSYYSIETEPMLYSIHKDDYYYNILDELYPNYYPDLKDYPHLDEANKNDSIWDYPQLEMQMVDKWSQLFIYVGADKREE
jgi:hypothetical protein